MKKEKFWKKRRLKKGYVYIVSSSSNIFLTLANRKKEDFISNYSRFSKKVFSG